ncbi:hypothetical protein [Actinocorallia populi]|uniref:hypothetical protein n=1 Tax=Actinocorallia populi TaxID=2079200 RepID=UPI0018E5135E|nr:hypothetical protein [Actinocorallia populi]
MSRSDHTASPDMERVIDFLRRRNDALDSLDWDQDLVEDRILDSVGFVEFLFLLEELTGERIDPKRIDAMNFRTLNRINAAFLAGKAVP